MSVSHKGLAQQVDPEKFDEESQSLGLLVCDCISTYKADITKEDYQYCLDEIDEMVSVQLWTYKMDHSHTTYLNRIESVLLATLMECDPKGKKEQDFLKKGIQKKFADWRKSD